MRTLKDILSRIRVETDEQSPNLDMHFLRTPQLCEALPDRLRGLLDLATFAEAESRTKAPPPDAASRVVERIWRHAISLSPVEGYDEHTVRMDDDTGALNIHLKQRHPGVRATHIRTVEQSDARGNGPTVNLLRVDRLDAPLETGTSLPRPITAALMLAADVAADQTHGAWEIPPTEQQSGYEGLFAYSSYRTLIQDSLVYFPWPLPKGFSLPFYAAFSSRWGAKLRAATSLQQGPSIVGPDRLDEMARHFVLLVVYLWGGSTTLWVRQTPPRWGRLGKLVARLASEGVVPARTSPRSAPRAPLYPRRSLPRPYRPPRRPPPGRRAR